MQRCQEGPKNQHFYKTIKPFLSARNKADQNLMIMDGEDLLTDPKMVAEAMNTFYSNIANEIGSDPNLPQATAFENCASFTEASIAYHQSHPSVEKIHHSTDRAILLSRTSVNLTLSKSLKILTLKNQQVLMPSRPKYWCP